MSTESASTQPAVLLLGNYRPAVVIARALSAHGFRVILGHQGEEHGCRFSRCVDEIWNHPRMIDDDLAFSMELEAFLNRRRDISFVMPVTEEFVNWFASLDKNLIGNATLVSPHQDTVSIFSDKLSALDLAISRGVATLPYGLVHDHSGLVRRSVEIGFPLTIRPIGTTARLDGKKALILADIDELEQALPVWPAHHKTLLLQKFASGQRRNFYFAARNGKIIAACESSILRTDDPDGTGLAVEGHTVSVSQAILGDTEKLVEATGYTGIGLAQFIVDPATATRCFLELNPRVSGSHAVPEMAGIPLSILALKLAKGECADAGELLLGRPGLRYAWTSGDLMAAKMALINRCTSPAGFCGWLWRAAKTAVQADGHMIWRLSDPLPGIVAVCSVLPRFARLRNWSKRFVNPSRRYVQER